jgi:hypothetical protein
MTKQTTLEPTVVATTQNADAKADQWWAKSSTPPKTQANPKQKMLQVINFNLGSFDDENRCFTAIGSTPVVDRQGDVVEQDGWDLENFKNNPVIPWAHDYYQPPIARATSVGVSDGVLQFVCQFPPEGLYPFADTIWNLYRNQFMFAFSVGFIPEEPEEGYSWDGNTFAKCELLEISAVVVPANPQALALAAKMGVIDTAQTKQLIKKLTNTADNLKEILVAQASDAAQAAEDALNSGDISKAVHAGIVKALSDLGISNKDGENSLTDNASNNDNENMSKKDLGEADGGMSLTPTQHAGVKKMVDTLKDVSATLIEHSKALTEHSDTMKAHAATVTEKAMTLSDQADKLFDLLDHNGDETSDKQSQDSSSDAGDDADDGLSKSAKTSKKKDVVAAEGTEDGSQDDASKAEDTNVDGEVKSEGDKAAETAEADDAKVEEVKTEEVETKDADAETAEGEVAAATTDGADQDGEGEKDGEAEDEKSEEAEDETFDPNNLSDEQVEKILANMNARVKSQK